MAKIQNLVLNLKKQKRSDEQILKILYNITGKKYSINTIKKYCETKMDVKKDNIYMEKWRKEYQKEEKINENQTILEEMFEKAKIKGYFQKNRNIYI
jgi:hypothetical protein